MAENPSIKGFVARHGLKLGAARFIAGEEIKDAIGVVRRLNANGIRATIDYLGEAVSNPEQVQDAVKTYVEVLRRIAADGIEANVSLKPTQMGLDISSSLCRDAIGEIAEEAARFNNFVRMDMEDSNHTQATIEVFKDLHSTYDNVGLVIQSYLYRSQSDVRELAEIGANLRICKGAYNEPEEVAFPAKEDVDENFVKLVEMNLAAGNRTAVATHDEEIIERVIALTRARGIPKDLFEFQMLYGIRRDKQISLAAAGYGMRVYVPFGREWYPYFMRRLAERPANVSFVIRSLVRH